MEFKKIISKKCYRGFFTVHIERHPQKPPYSISLNWDKKQAQKWKRLYDNLSREMNLKNDIQVSDLIRGEGVFKSDRKTTKFKHSGKKESQKLLFSGLSSLSSRKKKRRDGFKKRYFVKFISHAGFF